ncbi:putative oxidoreductase YjmC [compost metagenome]
MNTKTMCIEELTELVVSALIASGIEKDESGIVANVLINANLMGMDSHGVDLLPTYLRRIEQGGILKNPKKQVIFETSFMKIIDADGGIGPVTACQAATDAINQANENGISIVMVRNSNHIGMLGYYTRMIASKNQLGIVLTNSGPNVAAWGGKEAVLGNNALSVALPNDGGIPFVLDMATGEVACGKIRDLAEKGITEIPKTWALNAAGQPASHPQEFIDGGVVLPFGGHKGFGIGMVVDLLTGVLSGGSYSVNVKRQRVHADKISESCHTFIALDVSKIAPLEEFNGRVQDWLESIKNSLKADGVEEILIPGEKEKKAMEDRKDGIPIAMGTYNKLKLINDQLQLSLI